MKPSRLWSSALILAVVNTLGFHYIVGGPWPENLVIAVIASLAYTFFLTQLPRQSD